MIELYRTAWGLVGPGLRWDSLAGFARDAAAEGYSGVEFAVPILGGLVDGQDAALARLKEALADKERLEKQLSEQQARAKQTQAELEKEIEYLLTRIIPQADSA